MHWLLDVPCGCFLEHHGQMLYRIISPIHDVYNEMHLGFIRIVAEDYLFNLLKDKVIDPANEALMGFLQVVIEATCHSALLVGKNNEGDHRNDEQDCDASPFDGIYNVF